MLHRDKKTLQHISAHTFSGLMAQKGSAREKHRNVQAGTPFKTLFFWKYLQRCGVYSRPFLLHASCTSIWPPLLKPVSRNWSHGSKEPFFLTTKMICASLSSSKKCFVFSKRSASFSIRARNSLLSPSQLM